MAVFEQRSALLRQLEIGAEPAGSTAVGDALGYALTQAGRPAPGDGWFGGNYGADSLVSEDGRCRLSPAPFECMEIRAAYSRQPNLDEELPGSSFRGNSRIVN